MRYMPAPSVTARAAHQRRARRLDRDSRQHRPDDVADGSGDRGLRKAHRRQQREIGRHDQVLQSSTHGDSLDGS